MPMMWVEPELAYEVDGVKVYRCYKDDDWEQPLSYTFTTDKNRLAYECDYDFDVRDLPAWSLSADKYGGYGEVTEETTRVAIEDAVRCGLLIMPEG